MELISREDAIKCLDGSVLITRQSEAEAVREYFEMVIKRLENLPTIDIVRCGECEYADEYNHCKYSAWWNGNADFCSHGIRRKESR